MAKAQTAYFLFADIHRDAARAEAQAEAEEGAKVSVAVVAKKIGALWRALSDEEKAKYKEMAVQKGKELAEEAAAAHPEGEEGEAADQAAEPSSKDLPFGMPLTAVKRIMCLDAEVSRMSADAVKAVAKATELFIQLLAAKSAAVAKTSKRRAPKFSDLERAVRSDRRFVDMELKKVFAEDMFAEARGEGSHAKENVEKKHAKASAKATAKADAEKAAGTRSITDFFGKRPQQAAISEEL